MTLVPPLNATKHSPGFAVPEPYGPGTSSFRATHLPLDASFKSIFDDLSEGILVLDASGQRVYSNAAMNDLVSANACMPSGTLEPPFYVPVDQRQRYLLALQGTYSLLTLDGWGTTSTWLELAVPGRMRVRAKVTISAFHGPHGKFAAWMFKPELTGQTGGRPDEGRPSWGGADDSGSFLGSYPMSVVQSLTRRERDVLQLLLDGLRVPSIAKRLYVSPQTVRNHLKAIFRKFGAHSQIELMDNLRAGTGTATMARLRVRDVPVAAPTSPGT